MMMMMKEKKRKKWEISLSRILVQLLMTDWLTDVVLMTLKKIYYCYHHRHTLFESLWITACLFACLSSPHCYDTELAFSVPFVCTVNTTLSVHSPILCVDCCLSDSLMLWSVLQQSAHCHTEDATLHSRTHKLTNGKLLKPNWSRRREETVT